MELNNATLQLAVLGLPGLLWVLIDRGNRRIEDEGQLITLAKIFIFGLVTYTILSQIYAIRGLPFSYPVNSSVGSSISVDLYEVFWSVPLSIALALIWLAARTHGLVSEVLQRLGISDYSGCDDIWEYAFSRRAGLGMWVSVRDFSNDLVYQGIVKAYSDGGEVKELLLLNVIVYSSSGDLLYEQPGLYLSRPKDDITVDFYPEEEKNGSQGE